MLSRVNKRQEKYNFGSESICSVHKFSSRSILLRAQLCHNLVIELKYRLSTSYRLLCCSKCASLPKSRSKSRKGHFWNKIYFRPIAGFVNFCPYKIERINAYKAADWLSTLKHEMLHVLVFSPALFPLYGGIPRMWVAALQYTCTEVRADLFLFEPR